MWQEVPALRQHTASYVKAQQYQLFRFLALDVPLLDSCGPALIKQLSRSVELLRGVARSMGNLTTSPAVRREVTSQGGWKSLLALAQAAHKEVWFDALRALVGG